MSETLFHRLLVLLSGLALLGFWTQPAVAIDYLAYGELRGHLEPCGCSPETDLGGIRRLGIVLSRERSLHPQLVAFDLGNDLPLPAEAELKTPFLIAASAQFKPGAVLMNQLELQRLGEIDALRHLRPLDVPPYVLSNALPLSSRPFAANNLRSGKDWVALGYTYVPEFKSRLQKVGPGLLKHWQSLLGYTPIEQRVLLFSGPSEDLGAIVDAKLFGVIISANPAPLQTVIGAEERQFPDRLLRRKVPEVLTVPLGGQGMLRGGALRFAEAKPIADYLKPKDGPGDKSTTAEPWLKPATLVTWITPEASEAESPLKGIYEAYTQASQTAFRGQSQQRLKDLKSSPYAGAQACQACHPQQAKVYAQTKHAMAMHTLEIRGKQEDADCVACHVVGAKERGGYVSLMDSPSLVNVQCENCHGPRLAHTKNPIPKSTLQADPRQVCQSCHNRQHSPKFDFATYWQRIAHGKNQ